jgi:tetratricopeptide (TPR) repeat protein
LVIPVRRDKTNRYTMLETVRALAARLLADSPLLEEHARRHAGHFVAVAEQGYDEVWGPNETDWLARLYSNRSNLWRAFEWWLTYDPEQSQLLAGSLTWFWIRRQLASEAVDMLEAALGASSDDSPGRVRARFGLAMFTKWHDPAGATETLREVVAGAERFGLKSELWQARYNLGEVALIANDPDRAQAALEETYRWAAGIGEFRAVALCCLLLAHLSSTRGEHEQARAWVSESLAAAERWGSARVTVYCFQTRGWVELAAGQLDDALQAFIDASRLENEIWELPEIPVGTKLGLATVALAGGDLSAAVGHTQDALSRLEAHRWMSHDGVPDLFAMAACLHSASGNLDRAVALKALALRGPTGWDRGEPVSGWLAAIDETDSALTIQYPTRLDLLPEILALDEAVETR